MDTSAGTGQVLVTGLLLLVGPPAAGKSTFAAALIRLGRIDADGVISADRIRSGFFGEAVRLEDDPVVFQRVDELIAARITAGRPAVLDATNVTREGRDRARQHGGPASALRFPVDEQTLLARNSARRKPVRTDVVLKLAAAFRACASLEQLRSEGFTTVADAPPPEAVQWTVS